MTGVNATLFWLVLGLVVLAWVWWTWRPSTHRPEGQQAYDQGERAAMPPELAQGRLVLSETKLRVERPAPLIARVDQVYLTPTGELVPVETKTRYRHEVYLGDELELSVQAVVIAPQARRLGGRVAEYGYVRIVSAGRPPVYRRARLFPEADVVRLRARRLAVMAGSVAPRPAFDARVCRKCPQRPKCPHPADQAA